MQQYLVTGFDGTDELALTRRMAARPLHFIRARELKAAGNFITGGAILDEKGQMTGSMMLMQFPSEKELKEWMDKEPYVVENVWQRIDIRPFKIADV